jgi:hypothetical protein
MENNSYTIQTNLPHTHDVQSLLYTTINVVLFRVQFQDTSNIDYYPDTHISKTVLLYVHTATVPRCATIQKSVSREHSAVLCLN